MARIVLADCETTGLSPDKHEIIEIGLCIFDSVTFEIFDQWETKCKPIYPENGSPEAYKVNGFTEEEWEGAPLLQHVLAELVERTQNCTFMAFNYHFDLSFLEYNLAKHELKHKWPAHRVDLLSIAFAKIPHNKMQGWALRTVCASLGIPPEPKMHRALNGVMKEYEVYCKLMGK
jgi:DNA polymerase III alpha subunit (gram-positive type)